MSKPSTSSHDYEQEDEDYMSDLSKFIPSEQPSTKNPKKIPTKTIHNVIQPVSKKRKSKTNWLDQKRVQKELKQLEEDENTLQNLTSSIPTSNIGFKMLTQMGYTPGLGLGKSGRVDPIGVEIRRSRVGIGGEDPGKVRLRKEKERVEKEKAKVEQEEKGVEEMVEEFGVRKKLEWRNKRVVWSFQKAKAVLDGLENREVERMAVVETAEEKEEEEEEVITEEDLLEILTKLREEHCYCLFCGCQYESAEALRANCPGITEDDH